MQDMTVIENIANAIVIRAAKDYRRALRRLKKDPENEKALSCKAEVEEFFQSGWFTLLTHADGDYILEQLRLE